MLAMISLIKQHFRIRASVKGLAHESPCLLHCLWSHLSQQEIYSKTNKLRKLLANDKKCLMISFHETNKTVCWTWLCTHFTM